LSGDWPDVLVLGLLEWVRVKGRERKMSIRKPLEAPDGYELITVGSDFRTVDNIIWRRYRTVAIGVFERTLDDNPHLARIHRYTPFLPVGTQLRIPIYPTILNGAPQQRTLTRWWETAKRGMRTVLTTTTPQTGSALPTESQITNTLANP
jgi:phage tail protein X